MLKGSTSTAENMLDVLEVRKDFPILSQKINGFPLVYLDNAASTQKPRCVIDALTHYYETSHANIHRGIHTLAERATTAYEATRTAVKDFIGAEHSEEIIFTSGATEGINLVAYTFGKKFINPGDEILLSATEHHSNIVPWYMLCEERGAALKIIPVTDEGEIIFEEFEKLLNERTKLVAVGYASNTLGVIHPVKEIARRAREVGAYVLIDGAQAAAHLDIDVKDLGCDFFVFSSHKLYGPTGTGVLYGKRALLEAMPPYRGGGEMIKDVAFDKIIYNDLPYKYEAGTPNIADVTALKSALEYVRKLGKKNIAAHEDDLLRYATEALETIKGLRILGRTEKKIGIISFVAEGVHHQDLGILLDNQGVAVRTGNHCTQPLMARLGVTGTTRASFAVYNTRDEVDVFVKSLDKAVAMLR